MKKNNASSIVLGTILISLGLVFLVIHNVDLALHESWPIIFILLAIGFYLPPLLIPALRQSLAPLFIPGSVMFALGIMFTYATMTNDWLSISYSWTLIPAGVGLGLFLGAWAGGWGKKSRRVGTYMLAISIGVFAIFSAIFAQEDILKNIAPFVLIAVGTVMMVQALRRLK